ncbi:MAG: plastocyanin/azurin family copper-binding protein [Rudaea sp.]
MRFGRCYFVLVSLALSLGATQVCMAKNWDVSVGGQTSYDDGYGGTYSTPNLVFAPANLSVNVGDTVTFHGRGGGAHNVHADDNSFRCANGCDGSGGSGTPSGDAWISTITFTTPGLVKFHCDNHVSMGMVGSVTVNSVAGVQPITGATSGSWYDPQQSGEGFLVQVAPDNTLIAYWFVYTPDGTQQAWLVGSGSYTPGSNTATIEVLQVVGAKFPPNFDHNDLVATDWGKLTFTFTDCNHGTVSWDSKLPAYGIGSQPLTKIIGVDGATCN